MRKCCDAAGHELAAAKDYQKNKDNSGKDWTPAFIESVDPEKCIGCGMCVRVCLNNVYEIKEINGKKVSVVVNPDDCFGDCHCHKVCPVPGGAMICKPKVKH